MAKLVKDETGQIFLDEGGGVYTPMTEDQARVAQEAIDSPIGGAGEAAAQGLNNLSSGLLSFFDDEYKQINQEGRARSEALNAVSPLTNPVAQFAPQIAAGVATAGMGLPAVAGTEALLGAATTPETPVQGAVIGGLLGAAGELAGPALGWAANKGRGAASRFGFGASLPDEALPPGVPRPGSAASAVDLEQVAAPGATGAPPSPVAPSGPIQEGVRAANAGADAGRPTTMAERVTERLERETARTDVAPTRVMGDMMTPDELAEYGIPVTPGQRQLLTATTADPNQARSARALMADEEARRSSPAMGRGINDTLAQQVEASTNFLAHQLDVPQGVALTDGTMSEVMAGIGNRLDAIADEMGNVPVTKAMRDEISEVMRLSAGRHTGLLQRTIDDVLKKVDNNGGMLSGRDWGLLRSELGKQMDKGMKIGRIDWIEEAADVQDVFMKAMESKLPTETQRELRRLRKQYAIGATLAKPGVRNADGQLNPVSFYSNWKRPQSLKHRGKDDVGRFMNTMVTLTQKRVPDSGTATRLGRMAEDSVQRIPIVGDVYKGLMSP